MLAGTSLVTMLPAPTIAFSPTVMPHSRVALEPMDAPFLISVGMHVQSCIGLQTSVFVGRPGIEIIDERDVMSDKDIVFDDNALADKGVTRNFTVFADLACFWISTKVPIVVLSPMMHP